jgi:hypothetical protein
MQHGQPPQAAAMPQAPQLRPLLLPLQQALTPTSVLTVMATTARTTPSHHLLGGNINCSW